jgi:glycyl-tRNA synthetase beta chain
VANIAASDGGAALVAGNERVLRARLSDARFFWDQDLKTPLEDLLPKLDGVVFHAKLGTQGQRVRRLERLAGLIAPMVGADPALAARAARLAKADLASGMVGEFPELQGVMGGYYARAGGEAPAVAAAIAQHYRPLGPTDAVPIAPVAVAVALADKLDQLAGFFAADERPTGSSDPFALRRAMLGIIRIVTSAGLRLELKPTFALALEPFEALTRGAAGAGGFDVFKARRNELVAFLIDRLRVQLRETGLAVGVITAVAYPNAVAKPDTDITRVISRANLLQEFLSTPQGEAMLGAYRRASNILRSEEKKEALNTGNVDEDLLRDPAETQLNYALKTVSHFDFVARDEYMAALNHLGAIRSPVDAFFKHVLVNDPDKKLRINRLRLLSRLKSAMESVADLSKIEA